jgi:TAK1-binding protein 1
VTGSRLGNQENTRCLGNYLVKGCYKEFEELTSARAEPVIAEPEIHGGIELDESCRYVAIIILVYTWTYYKTNTEIAKELNMNLFLDKLQEYIKHCLQHKTECSLVGY